MREQFVYDYLDSSERNNTELSRLIELARARPSKGLLGKLGRLSMSEESKRLVLEAQQSHVFFIRHAEPVSMPPSGSNEIAEAWLTPVGAAQARSVGKFILNSLGPDTGRSVKMYHTTAHRSEATAYIAKDFLGSCGIRVDVREPIPERYARTLMASNEAIFERVYGPQLSDVYNAVAFFLHGPDIRVAGQQLGLPNPPGDYGNGFLYQAGSSRRPIVEPCVTT